MASWPLLSTILEYALIILLVLYTLKKSKQSRDKIKSLNQENETLTLLLNSLKTPWCLYYKGSEALYTSGSFRKLFDIDDTYELSYNHLFRLFGVDKFDPFYRAMKDLNDFGGQFNLLKKPKNSALDIEIRGFQLKDNLYALFFEDMTEKIKNETEAEKQNNYQANLFEKLEKVIQNMPIALWHRDDRQRIDFCNKAYADLLDIGPEKVIADSKELIEEDNGKILTNLSRRAQQTHRNQSLDHHCVLKGERRFINFNEIPLKNGCSIGFANDISVIEQKEKDLRRHIDAHEDLLKQISTPMCVFDESGHIALFNKAYQKLFGLEEPFLRRKPHLLEIFDELRKIRKLPDYTDFLVYKRQHEDYLRNLLDPLHELWHLPDGTILRMVVTPYVKGLIYVFEDMTEKLALEHSYKTLMAVQRETINHLKEGIIVFGNDGKIRLFNEAMEILWNNEESPLEPNQHLKDIIPHLEGVLFDKNQEGTWLNRLQTLFAKRLENTSTIKLKDKRYIDYSYSPLSDGSHLLSFMDVTDKRIIQDVLRECDMSQHQTLLT